MDLINVQLLFQQGLFEIPNYQRGYAWGKKQIEDLIEDLEYAQKQSVKQHFTGSITVLQKKDEKGDEKVKVIFPKKFKIFEVVDGQQRLTTFSIFTYCIYNRLKKLGLTDDKSSDILKNVIYDKTSILELNDDCNDFYKKYIITGGIEQLPKDTTTLSNKSQMNLAEAKKQITRYLDTKRNINQVEDIYITLVNKFNVNFDILEDDCEVGIVFETMNNRGLSLKQIDKVKNYLIFLCSRMQNTQLSKHINTSFGEIFKNLMNVSHTTTTEDEFLRYSYIIYEGLYKESDIHNEIKTSLFPKNNSTLFDKVSPQKIKDYVDFLTDISDTYSIVFNSDVKNIQVKQVLDKILFLGNLTNIAPLLIVIFKKHQNGKMNDKILIELLQIIEIFLFRVYHIAKKRSDSAQTALYQLAFEFHNRSGKSNGEVKNEIKELLKKNNGDDEDFKKNLDADNFYINKSPQSIAYLFYEWECFKHNDTKSQFALLQFNEFEKAVNSLKLAIEHIEPQAPQNRKPLSFVHKVDNLTITFENSKLSNNEFNAKKAIYRHSKLIVENELATYENWTKDEIKNRTKTLIQFALKRWKI